MIIQTQYMKNQNPNTSLRKTPCIRQQPHAWRNTQC